MAKLWHTSFTMNAHNSPIGQFGDGDAVARIGGNDIYERVFFDCHTYILTGFGQIVKEKIA